MTLWIALAGGLGAATRFLVDGSLKQRWGDDFPWATILINVTGSFLLGLLTGLSPGTTWHLVAGVGFCGGYTTFSTASFETVRLVQQGRHRAALVQGIGVMIVCVSAASLGVWLGRLLA